MRTGISDGLFTELQGENVVEGSKVIDGVASGTRQPTPTASNPMGGSQQQGGRGGRPGGGF